MVASLAQHVSNYATILVIDRDNMYREFMDKLLTSWGYHIICVASLKQARETLVQTDVDALIFDSSTDEEIQESEKLRAIQRPLILLSDPTVVDGVQSGSRRVPADEVLPKPFSCERLRHTLTRLLGG